MNPLLQFAAEPHIDIRASVLFHIGPLPVTNSMMLGLVGYSIVLGSLFYVLWAIKKGKKNKFISFVLWAYEALYNQVEGIIGDKEVAKKLAPLPIALFFIIITNYWIGVLPFVGPITMNGNIPVFRSLLADMNTTFAFAITSMVAVQVFAIKQHGFFGNLGRYFINPFKNPIMTFVGLLEIIAELSRLVALSLRLFGNVFAGEVLIIMIGFMTSYAASIAILPFMAFELFIGTIQAYVFFMLTTVFISLGREHHGDDEKETHSSPEHSSLKPLSAGSEG
jgi:F-type H+-transporting ATPase subunit a